MTKTERDQGMAVKIDRDLEPVVNRLARIYQTDKKGLLSRLVRWFEVQTPKVQRVVQGQPHDEIEIVVAEMLEAMAKDIRSGKLTKLTQPRQLPGKAPPGSAILLGGVPDGHDSSQDVRDAQGQKGRRRGKRRNSTGQKET